MLSNIIIIAVITVFMLIGIKRGIAKTLLNVAGVIATVMLSDFIATFLSDWIYEAFLRQNIINNLTEMIQNNNVTYAVENCVDAVPAWIRGILVFLTNLFGSSQSNMVGSITLSNDLSSVVTAIEKPLGAAVTAILGIILLIVLFIIIFIFVKMLIRFALRFFKIPVIRQINQFFGGILGVCEGIIFVFLAINIFYAIMSYTNPAILNNSFVTGDLFKFFCTFI